MGIYRESFLCIEIKLLILYLIISLLFHKICSNPGGERNKIVLNGGITCEALNPTGGCLTDKRNFMP